MIIEDSDIRSLYFTSAENYLNIMTQGLLSLEKKSDNPQLINDIFRAAHSFKSESLTMGFENIGNLCHSLEDIFGIFQKTDKRKYIDSNLTSQLLEVVDTLKSNLERVKDGQAEESSQDKIESLNKVVETLQKKKTKSAPENKPEKSSSSKDSKTEKTKVEEPKKLDKIEKPEIETISVRTQILDSLMNLMEEFVILKLRFDRALLEQNYDKMKDFKKHIEILLSELQFYISQARLIPIGQIFENFPRLVRDMSKNQGKSIDFEMRGMDLRIDRTIADRLVEPLVHLLRNSVDHGIEMPAERKKLNKLSEGKVIISARREKDRAVLEISDDGRGFDFESIRKVVQRDLKLSDREAKNFTQEKLLSFLYRGGISTNTIVTSYSGRGMGIYAVKSALDFLGGSIRIETQLNKGTLFTMEFPLSLAIIKALLIDVNNEKFAIPTVNIIQSIRLPSMEVKKAAGLDAFVLNGEEITILDLGDRFFHKPIRDDNKPYHVVVVNQANKKFGFLVRKILGMEEMTVKSLSQFTSMGKDFSGATVLGDGKVALIIDVPAIFNDY